MDKEREEEFYGFMERHSNMLVDAVKKRDLDDVNRLVWLMKNEILDSGMDVDFKYMKSVCRLD